MSTDISKLSEIDGFLGASLVDSDSGLMLSAEAGSGSLDLELAGAANMEIVRAKNAAIKALGLNDHIEDVLISLETQYDLIRPLASNPDVFVYVALDRKKSNLGMARLAVKNVEAGLTI
ncbi:hypothetical protein [Actibacterium lipolyticum]|uniref:Roadblock/LAMTOR2 domain-containing protein n=1 Tax=Actibacterium lipolyticum TaxID=1524263 RepID=A0A238KRL9_9RHOB|nr:hypothetical protein [Actibacterium lipolyticum]SMX45327.1 hypothetical protein COL8621_02765 [Actibacterium lipolyticum]